MSEAPLIMIVDDDEVARDGIRELVESFGYALSHRRKGSSNLL
jgi:CheY-like chemotaxis protein